MREPHVLHPLRRVVEVQRERTQAGWRLTEHLECGHVRVSVQSPITPHPVLSRRRRCAECPPVPAAPS